MIKSLGLIAVMLLVLGSAACKQADHGTSQYSEFQVAGAGSSDLLSVLDHGGVCIRSAPLGEVPFPQQDLESESTGEDHLEALLVDQIPCPESVPDQISSVPAREIQDGSLGLGLADPITTAKTFVRLVRDPAAAKFGKMVVKILMGNRETELLVTGAKNQAARTHALKTLNSTNWNATPSWEGGSSLSEVWKNLSGLIDRRAFVINLNGQAFKASFHFPKYDPGHYHADLKLMIHCGGKGEVCTPESAQQIMNALGKIPALKLDAPKVYSYKGQLESVSAQGELVTLFTKLHEPGESAWNYIMVSIRTPIAMNSPAVPNQLNNGKFLKLLLESLPWK
ncbi:MAG: hypothetical protein WCI18_02420 [Pseudomonadota bacterium]